MDQRFEIGKTYQLGEICASAEGRFVVISATIEVQPDGTLRLGGTAVDASAVN